MSTSKPFFIVSLVTISLAASAWAGNPGGSYNETQDHPWTTLSHPVYHPRHNRGPMKVVNFAGQVTETFLHWPQIVAEAVYGDRTIVSKRGVLAPREVAAEDQVFSSGE